MGNDFFHDLKKEVLEIRDRHPNLSLDNTFVAWFLRAFIVESENDAVQSLTGAGGDKGVDALFIDNESRVIFLIQGKYHQGPRACSEKRPDIIALADLGRALLLDDPGMFKGLLNKVNAIAKRALEKARPLIQRHNYRLSLQFVTTGKVSDVHREEAAQRVEEWKTASFDTFSREDLLRLMQDYVEGAAPPTPTVFLPLHGEEVFKRHDNDTGFTSWIFTMKGFDVGRLFKTIGIRLFARNIRGFLGINTEINRGMSATLKTESQYFWYFNNGVTIVCDEAQHVSKGAASHLRVTNAQIINGQQTTRCLAMQKDKDADVLVKLIQIPRGSTGGHSEYSHVVSEIVSATNWQNAISQIDLKSNDPEQVRIEREFRKFNYQYLRKRMNKSEARQVAGRRYAWHIKKDELARAVGACVLDPYEVRSGKDRLFEDDVYSKIFNGRPTQAYLTFYWFNQMIKSHSWGNLRRRYTHWGVVNFLWSQLGDSLSRFEVREKLRYIAERQWDYRHELQPFLRMVDLASIAASAFYRANKTRSGTVQNEQDFFKHSNLHLEFRKYWRKQPASKRIYFANRIKSFLNRLNSIEI